MARQNQLVAFDFDRLADDLAQTIKLGYDVERDDPALGFETPADDEIRWLAFWLVSEGWGPQPGVASPMTRDQWHERTSVGYLSSPTT